MIAINEEIPRLPLGEEVRRAGPNYDAQRGAIQDWIERNAGKLSATSVLVEDPSIRLMVMHIADGRMIEDQQERATDRQLAVDVSIRLATISGRPLAHLTDKAAHFRGVKVGLRPLNSDGLRALEARGGSALIMREYPATFDCTLKTAVRLLGRYGYRLAGPDPDTWLLYEVGGPLEKEVALYLAHKAEEEDNATYLKRARDICPEAFEKGKK